MCGAHVQLLGGRGSRGLVQWPPLGQGKRGQDLFMGIAPCEAWAHRRRASLELMWPASRGDLVGLHHGAQVALPPDRFFLSGSFSSLHSFFCWFQDHPFLGSGAPCPSCQNDQFQGQLTIVFRQNRAGDCSLGVQQFQTRQNKTSFPNISQLQEYAEIQAKLHL